MRKILKNQKGLTLVELLAVIVILGIIAAIAVPAIANIIDNSRKDAQIANAEALYDSARLAQIGENLSGVSYFHADDGDESGTDNFVDLNDTDSNYLEAGLLDPHNNDEGYKVAYVHYDGDNYNIYMHGDDDTEYFNGQSISFIRSAGRDGFDDLVFEDETS